jgi:hypothetical protein
MFLPLPNHLMSDDLQPSKNYLPNQPTLNKKKRNEKKRKENWFGPNLPCHAISFGSPRARLLMGKVHFSPLNLHKSTNFVLQLRNQTIYALQLTKTRHINPPSSSILVLLPSPCSKKAGPFTPVPVPIPTTNPRSPHRAPCRIAPPSSARRSLPSLPPDAAGVRRARCAAAGRQAACGGRGLACSSWWPANALLLLISCRPALQCAVPMSLSNAAAID